MSSEPLIDMCMRVELGANPRYQEAYVRALIDFVYRIQPSKVIEIGTYSGTSTCALAAALTRTGVPASKMTTIDINHALWKKTKASLAPGFKQAGLDMDAIQSVESDFKALNAEDFISPGDKIVLYYDIHDLEDRSGRPNSPLFFENWVPRINNGIVAMHDISPLPSNWTRPKAWGAACSESHTEHWGGQFFHGNGEAGVLVEYLNKYRAPLNSMGQISMAWFFVKNGKPRC